MSMTDEKKTTAAGEDLDQVGRKGDRAEAATLRRELFDDELVDQFLAAADERGVSLTGAGGFLPAMIKSVLERGMSAELTDHLGYAKHVRVGHGRGNSRNGTTPKTIGTEIGDIALDQPRDRNSSGTAPSLQRWCPRAPVGWAGWKT